MSAKGVQASRAETGCQHDQGHFQVGNVVIVRVRPSETYK